MRSADEQDVDALRQSLEAWFDSYIPTPTQRSKQRRSNIAVCAGLFYTNVPLAKLKIVGLLLAWLCHWDDEVDHGLVTHDSERTEAYFKDSIAFIRTCLQPEHGYTPPAPGRLHNCGVFVDIGKAMLLDQSLEDRDRFAQSLVEFIEATSEATTLSRIELSPPEQYIQHRRDTIGATFCCYSMNWAYGLEIPTWIWETDATKSLIHEVSMGIWLANDVISLKKEIASEEYNSIIPILVYYEGISVQQAVDKAVGMMERSYEKFKVSAGELRHIVKREEIRVRRDVETWIEAITDALVGSLAFHLQTVRYLPRSAFEAGSNKFMVVL
jgi:hypothetical protein